MTRTSTTYDGYKMLYYYAMNIHILGKEMVDYIADYLENIRQRRVFPDVKPGYMREMLPENPPVEGEAWDRIFKDVEGVIMPGVIAVEST